MSDLERPRLLLSFRVVPDEDLPADERASDAPTTAAALSFEVFEPEKVLCAVQVGAQVEVRDRSADDDVGHARWYRGAVHSRAPDGTDGTVDVRYEDGTLEIDLEPARVRPFHPSRAQLPAEAFDARASEVPELESAAVPRAKASRARAPGHARHRRIPTAPSRGSSYFLSTKQLRAQTRERGLRRPDGSSLTDATREELEFLLIVSLQEEDELRAKERLDEATRVSYIDRLSQEHAVLSDSDHDSHLHGDDSVSRDHGDDAGQRDEEAVIRNIKTAARMLQGLGNDDFDWLMPEARRRRKPPT